jgi:hypothetical protein
LEHLTNFSQKSGDSTTGPASTTEVESVPPIESSVEDEEMMPRLFTKTQPLACTKKS